MTWSTRQLAELAGTSVRAVRHYHDIGLLAEPERASNGYKRYGVAHLLRVLRIKRLADLGIPLSQIAEMGETDRFPHDALQTLDAELAGTIERLQRIRVELALILRQGTHADLPPDMGRAAAVMTDADRDFTVILTRVLGPSGLSALRGLLNDQRNEPAMSEFDVIPADADERTRIDLAERLAPHVGVIIAEYPEISAPADDSPVGAKRAAETVGKALLDLYNPAQIDVLVRVNQLILGSDEQSPAS
ncbi:MerR family transcriptional regulator [Nocardia jinanensis]|uniref:Transcriptional regulator, MerR family protein n=1 Tax=Nocardia jinanensis TaxID=382504 RepID=A0A917VYL7_9NOCA|nr:MerR family transcriptional regulator [Nocardia jinanensis]GGL39041.1 transcriptional regulator, MerR family protein [Nocardia jinanensis]